ncbi:protocatechuate 3,4-dioxygenase beta subunit [Flavobacteriaceae bacterium MAR_2010_72]|nr:protocatechuate 3,4-dioxygenase beta subunit [Flavobacteriaceae bacterium MAR_2010_72]TVZ59773.1 protocatechuate 3,4-dioxygenase beta subunit [Flavobacteriaceae bacterium MAR_2010_105]
MIKSLQISFIILLFWSCAESQNKPIGGPCEGCEAVYEYGNKALKAIDTIPGFKESSNKIKISGTVYKSDGKTPAKDVILYIYQTNEKGRYPSKADSKGWERRHGYMRTWLKTDAKGKYTFYTSRPASYPNSTIPQHIHITVKEPDKNEYYIEDFFFSDDPLLPTNIKNRSKPRGGKGVITLAGNGPIKQAQRDIILGLHIPGY